MRCPECLTDIDDMNPLLEGKLDKKPKCHLCVICDEFYNYDSKIEGDFMYKCVECDEFKLNSSFVPDPRDEKQELYICKDCAKHIEYEFGELMSGRASEREEGLCL